MLTKEEKERLADMIDILPQDEEKLDEILAEMMKRIEKERRILQ